MTCGIYQISHKDSDRRYIGSSKNINRRFGSHRYDLRKKIHGNSSLQNAWNKYGEESFSLDTILICEEKDLIMYEQLIVDSYKSYEKEHGYNIRKIVNSPKGIPTSEKQKQTIRDLWKNPEFVNNYYKGRKALRNNKEWLSKISKHKIGDKHFRLTLVKLVEKSTCNKWLLKCDCGKEVVASLMSVVSGGTKSCGCFHKDMAYKKLSKFVTILGKTVNRGEALKMLNLTEYSVYNRIKKFGETFEQSINYHISKISKENS